ncbi:MAG: MMPL family transporter, partial [Solirubrobacteraceae bacterium]
MMQRLEGLVRVAARRPALTVAIVLTLALAGTLLSLGLKPSAGSDTFVSRSTSSFQATDQDHRQFGGDAVVILIREPLTDLVQTKDLATVTFLEACLAGQYVVPSTQLQSFQPAPPGAHAPYGGYNSPCGKLMKAKPVQVVYGPGTFLNRAVAAVNLQVRALLSAAQQQVTSAGAAARAVALGRGMTAAQAAQAARSAQSLASAQQTQTLERLYLNSGISGTPKIDDPQFIPQIVFDQTRGVNQPKSRFAYLFPTANSALIQVRLRASLSDAQQAQAISWIRQAVRMPMFASAYNGKYIVSGEPVVVNDLAAKISGSIAGLLIAAVLVMAATLMVVFRSRLRLLPLAIALAAAGVTFGALSVVGGSLTMASIAVLPILIGLAVDYAIQFQSRAQEAPRGEDGEPLTAQAAVVRAARVGDPNTAGVALATATRLLVLVL